MATDPMDADTRITEIAARVPFYDGPWSVEWDDGKPDEHGWWLIGYPTTDPLAGLIAKVPDYGNCLADFIAHARADVPWLLAEVTTLSTQLRIAEGRNAELADQLEKYVGHEPTVAEEVAYLNRCLDAVQAVCEEAERNAARWEQPLPVPEWVAAVRAALEGITTADLDDVAGVPQ